MRRFLSVLALTVGLPLFALQTVVLLPSLVQAQAEPPFVGINTGDVTLGAFGSSPAAKGASISGQVVTLQPADATHPGSVSTGSQTFAGAKTFNAITSFAGGDGSVTWVFDGTTVGGYGGLWNSAAGARAVGNYVLLTDGGNVFVNAPSGGILGLKVANSTQLAIAADHVVLTPGAAPSSPAEGWVYANSTDHHLYFHNGTTWKQLDN